MASPKRKTGTGILKSILFAHLILCLHLLLFGVLGLLVVFIGGMAQYLFWILLLGLAFVGTCAYWFYRRLRKEGKTLGEAMRSPVLQGRTVEVTLLGGLATLKLDPSRSTQAIEAGHQAPPLQIEDPHTARIREMSTLAQLLEKRLITPDEFDKAKQRLLGISGQPR